MGPGLKLLHMFHAGIGRKKRAGNQAAGTGSIAVPPVFGIEKMVNGEPVYPLVQKYASWRWYLAKSSQPRQ